MKTALGRLERAALQARERRKCPPHPKGRTFWQAGDYATPDKLVCGRCFAVLAQRTHEPDAGYARHLADHGARVKAAVDAARAAARRDRRR